MSPTAITRADFEALAARLVEALPRVNSAPTLVQSAAWLLEGELAVLLQRQGESRQFEPVASWPRSPGSVPVTQILDTLRWRDLDNGPDSPGYPLEDPDPVRPWGVTDAVLAFDAGGKARPEEYRLVVLRMESCKTRYSTYHCAVASALLTPFVRLEAARREHRTRTNYAQLLSLELLPKIAWSEFRNGIRAGSQEKADDPNFMGPAAILWLGYHKRPGYSLDDSPERPAAPFDKLYDYLAGEGFADKQLADGAMAVRRQGDDARKAVALVVEHGWRRIYQAAGEGAYRNLELPNGAECLALLELSSALAVDALASCNVHKGRGSCELGRDTLRLYLATLVARAGALKRRCLGIVDERDDPVVPSAEIRREMLVNLARFMLSVVEIVERRLGIFLEPRAMSKVEALDGLLYVVDRYAHVELEVDERLHVRERLARGLSSEVQRHLVHHFYRDHLLHVVDVFLLGHLLLETHFPTREGRRSRMVDQMPRPEDAQHTAEDMCKHHLRDWAVAALFHDIGYQVDPDRDALEDPKVVRRFFALQRPARNERLDPRDVKSATCRDWVEKLAVELAGPAPERSWLPTHGSCSIKDHGILSALRVAQVLAHSDSEGGPESHAFPSLTTYRAALHAIAHHNLFEHTVRYQSEPLSCLLRLCDEVQEWGRRRVNIERLVKHLYLEIEEGRSDDLTCSEDLEHVGANVVFVPKVDRPFEAEVVLADRATALQFWLTYRSPVEAHYDAITMLLSKAYNLQHLDQSGTEMARACADWRIVMCFPRPKEYRGLTELGIYSIVRERIRGLPDLLRYRPSSLPAGLSSVADREDGDAIEDVVAIVVKGGTEGRCGHQSFDPGGIRDQVIDIKQRMLAGRLVAPENQWMVGR